MGIKEIYAAMRESGLANSQIEFSAIWLGRSPRYYSHLVAVGREPGTATLSALAWRLQRLAEQLPRGILRNKVNELAEQISKDAARRTLTDIRRPRSALQVGAQ